MVASSSRSTELRNSSTSARALDASPIPILSTWLLARFCGECRAMSLPEQVVSTYPSTSHRPPSVAAAFPRSANAHSTLHLCSPASPLLLFATAAPTVDVRDDRPPLSSLPFPLTRRFALALPRLFSSSLKSRSDGDVRAHRHVRARSS